MKKILTAVLLVAIAGIAMAQDIELQMGTKTNKKAYKPSMIHLVEGMQDGQLLVVEPVLRAIGAGQTALKVRLCDMEWSDVNSVTLPNTKNSRILEAFRTGNRLHIILSNKESKKLGIRHVAMDASSLEVMEDKMLVEESVERTEESDVWAVCSPNRQYYGLVYAAWSKKDGRAVAILYDSEMNMLWERPLAYGDVYNVLVSDSGTIVTMKMGMVDDNKDITAFRINMATAEGEKHGEYILDADVSDVALLNTDGSRVLAVALEGKGGYGLLRMGSLGHRKYTGLWGLVFDIDKQEITAANRHPFTNGELHTFHNEVQDLLLLDHTVRFVQKVDECSTPQGGAVLYQRAWQEKTQNMKTGVTTSETVYSQGIMVVQADMNGELTISRLPHNNQNATWPDPSADLIASGDMIYVVTNESKREKDDYNPDRTALGSNSLFLANMALAVYWFTPDGQGGKKVVERERKALLCSPLYAGSGDRYYLLNSGGLYPYISMLKLPSGK